MIAELYWSNGSRNSNMISKETFCKVIALMQEQDQVNEQVEKALELVADRVFFFGAHDRNSKAVRILLKEIFHDKYDYLDWWLYEHVEKVIYWEDRSFEVSTPEAFYDYMVMMQPEWSSPENGYQHK